MSEQESICGNCGKFMLIKGVSYGINPDSVCGCTFPKPPKYTIMTKPSEGSKEDETIYLSPELDFILEVLIKRKKSQGTLRQHAYEILEWHKAEIRKTLERLKDEQTTAQDVLNDNHPYDRSVILVEAIDNEIKELEER